MSTPPTGDAALLKSVAGRPLRQRLPVYLRLSGPGWLQSAITLGGGSLAGSLYLGVIGGFGLLWLQPLAMMMGIVMLSAIGYITMVTGKPPLASINEHLSPVLGYGWAVASIVASMVWAMPQYSLSIGVLQQNLLPGLLGIAMILLGGVLALRSWRRGALVHALPPLTPDEREQRKRIWIVIGLCMLYGVVLVGHGLPFWLGSAIFVTGSILLLQWMSRDPVERQLTPKAWAKAIVIGLATGGITHLVFQELFLVHLP